VTEAVRKRLERAALAAHAAKEERVTVATGALVELLAAVQDVAVIRRVCGLAATWVGVEPESDIGARAVGVLRRQLWDVRKGRL